jgi:hypothetical protein
MFGCHRFYFAIVCVLQGRSEIDFECGADHDPPPHLNSTVEMADLPLLQMCEGETAGHDMHTACRMRI